MPTGGPPVSLWSHQPGSSSSFPTHVHNNVGRCCYVVPCGVLVNQGVVATTDFLGSLVRPGNV